MTQTHKLVPIEPTEEMIDAAFKIGEIKAFPPYWSGNEVRRAIYQAMLASAPEVGEAPFGYLCDWGDKNGLQRVAFYYGEPGSATQDDWNEFPKVHLNLPLYTTPQPDRTAELEAKVAMARAEKDHATNRWNTLLEEKTKLESEIEELKEGVVTLSHRSIDNQLRAEKLQADNKRLVDVIRRNQSALLVLNTICSVAGLKAGQEKAYEMFEDNNKFLVEMEEKG